MQLNGRLEKFDFSDILQMLCRSGKSGKLALTERAGQGLIVLRQGRIIYAGSSAVRETLGNMLLCKGLITEAGLKRGLTLQRQAGDERRLGAILVDESLLSQQDLELVVKEQVEKVVLEMLRWHSGYFRFDELQLADCGEVEIDALEFLHSEGLPADELLLKLSVKLDEARRESSVNAVGTRSERQDEGHDADSFRPAVRTPATPLSTILKGLYAAEFTGEITLRILQLAQRIVRRGVLFRTGPLGFAGMGQFGVEPPRGGSPDFVRRIKLPLDQPSILTEAVVRKTVFHGSLEETAVNRTLIRSLGGSWPKAAVAAPLIVGGRVLLILYGDNLPHHQPFGPLEDLEVVLIEAGLEMERRSLAKREKQLADRR